MCEFLGLAMQQGGLNTVRQPVAVIVLQQSDQTLCADAWLAHHPRADGRAPQEKTKVHIRIR
jgi:hypothetical protein